MEFEPLMISALAIAILVIGALLAGKLTLVRNATHEPHRRLAGLRLRGVSGHCDQGGMLAPPNRVSLRLSPRFAARRP